MMICWIKSKLSCKMEIFCLWYIGSITKIAGFSNGLESCDVHLKPLTQNLQILFLRQK